MRGMKSFRLRLHCYTLNIENTCKSCTAYCIWNVISSFSILNWCSRSLGLFYHVLLKRDQGNWDWRLRCNDTSNAIGCNDRWEAWKENTEYMKENTWQRNYGREYLKETYANKILERDTWKRYLKEILEREYLEKMKWLMRVMNREYKKKNSWKRIHERDYIEESARKTIHERGYMKENTRKRIHERELLKENNWKRRNDLWES